MTTAISIEIAVNAICTLWEQPTLRHAMGQAGYEKICSI